jgi:hypothetical protein
MTGLLRQALAEREGRYRPVLLLQASGSDRRRPLDLYGLVLLRPPALRSRGLFDRLFMGTGKQKIPLLKHGILRLIHHCP